MLETGPPSFFLMMYRPIQVMLDWTAGKYTAAMRPAAHAAHAAGSVSGVNRYARSGTRRVATSGMNGMTRTMNDSIATIANCVMMSFPETGFRRSGLIKK